MLRLRFQSMQAAHSLEVGPAERFRICGNFVRELPSERAIAQYGHHQWKVNGGHFSRYDCLDPCIAFFSDQQGGQSRTLGPFAHLHVADRTAYADDRLFAKFAEEQELWRCFDLGSLWPHLVLASA